MANIYFVGTLGRGGISVNFAGGALFEPTDNGEFTNKRAARRAAAECALAWALSADGDQVEVAVVVQHDELTPELLTTCTARSGNRRVQWA